VTCRPTSTPRRYGRRALDEPTIDFLVRLDADLSRGVSADVTDDLRRLVGRSATPLLDGLRALHTR
jgi:hypothetical protein